MLAAGCTIISGPGGQYRPPHVADVVLAAEHGATSCSREAVWEMGASSAGTMTTAARRHGPTMPASSGDFTIEMPMKMQNYRVI